VKRPHIDNQNMLCGSVKSVPLIDAKITKRYIFYTENWKNNRGRIITFQNPERGKRHDYRTIK